MALSLKLLKEAAGKAAYYGKTKLSAWWTIVNQNFIDIEDAHNALEENLKAEIQESHDELTSNLDHEKKLRANQINLVESVCDKKYKPLEAAFLPTLSTHRDFSDQSWFRAINRCTVEAKSDGFRSYESITTAKNAGNEYAYAYYDLSGATKDTYKYTIEFDSKIGRDRWIIELGDRNKRPGASNKDDYDPTGVIYRQGTINGVYYIVNNRNLTEPALFDEWVHTRLEIDRSDNTTITYTISTRDGEYVVSDTVGFFDNTSRDVTSLGIYSWTNNTEACITNLTVSTLLTEDKFETNTIYLAREHGHEVQYVYRLDGKPVKLGDQSHLISEERILRKKADEDLSARITELETAVAQLASASEEDG